jgi:MFS family permease
VFVTSLTAYFIIRGLVAFHGTSFLVLGAAVVGDIYEPTARATAISWVLFGGLMGPAFGPLVGGIIITYQPWWVIFALQAGLAGIAFILALLFLPETIHYRRDKELEGLKFKQRISKIWTWTNPARLIDLCSDAGIIIVALASSSIIWNMYALLCPIRYVLNPRYGLSKPLESALFYLAPGSGYLLGAVFGGRWSDYMLKKMIRKREGEFIPEDRLRATYVPLGMIIPGSILVYGWAIKTEVGGIPVPVIAMFVQGVGQFFALPSLNTYCLDVMPSRSAEVIALNYMLRYLFAAVGTAAALPIIESIGVGWLSVISSLFLITTAGLVALTCRYGQIWRKGGVD